jgi:ATP-dependent RNA helicase DOB1
VYAGKVGLDKQVRSVHRAIKMGETMILRDELKNMKRVLRRLIFTSGENVVEIKGRVACELSTADELVVSELMFNGVFNKLEAPVINALLSCMVFGEGKKDEDVRLPGELAGPFKLLQDTARHIGTTIQDAKLPMEVTDFVDSFKPTIMEVVFAWSKGARFVDICKMTDLFEGSIIRAIRRLEELLRQLSLAAKGIGNSELELKFAAGITLIKRDIVFAASLYL